ncbi:MAG: complex I NDUFA9 subunit family protein [Thiohalobacterales bacterium]|nr:complex I NDUFA9 subunit family protein [Thiohalobacterales bacterium]
MNTTANNTGKLRTETVCIIGGTGFVGRHLAHRLILHGYRVRIPTRHPQRHRPLGINPGVRLVEADIHDHDTLREEFGRCGIVVNLAGILNETGGSSFRQTHEELPRNICRAMHASGVRRLLHMSALNADAGEQHSSYLKTKGMGEDLVHAEGDAGLLVTSFRPSVIFGEGDSFFNRFAGLLKLSPLFFPLACPESRFAPVFVGDVVEAFCRSIDPVMAGERLDLCGPEVFTLRELVEYTRAHTGSRARIIGLGDGLSRLQARLLGLVPGKPFTMDNYHSLQKQSTCSNNALPELGIDPASIEAIVPAYLAGRNARGRYPDMRTRSRRSGP